MDEVHRGGSTGRDSRRLRNGERRGVSPPVPRDTTVAPRFSLPEPEIGSDTHRHLLVGFDGITERSC